MGGIIIILIIATGVAIAMYCCPNPQVSFMGGLIIGCVMAFIFENVIIYWQARVKLTYDRKQHTIKVAANTPLDTAELSISDLAGNALYVFMDEVQRARKKDRFCLISRDATMVREGRDFKKLIHYKQKKSSFSLYKYEYKIKLLESFPETFAHLPDKFLVAVVNKSLLNPAVASKICQSLN